MLTAKQHELVCFINDRLKETGVSPSFEEMKEALDLKSKSGVHRVCWRHRAAMRGAEQRRGRLPAGQCRRPVQRALFPVAPAMRVEQLIGQRPDQAIAQRPGFPRKAAMPCRARDVQRPAGQAGCAIS